MLAKYNLYVGNRCTSSSKDSCAAYGEEATGLQNSTMTGYDALPRNGVIEFSSTNYWSSKVSTYPEYVFDSNSTIFPYIENYKAYLESQDVAIEEARLIKVEELNALGCNSSKNTCSGAPKWVYSTSYWTGTAHIYNSALGVYSGSGELDLMIVFIILFIFTECVLL